MARHASSGLTARDFCRNENLKESSFYAWRRELARRDEESSEPKRKAKQLASSPFLPIALTAVAPAPIEITLAANVSVRVSDGCDASLLKMVLSALEGS
jgi:hypothetical protein